MKIPKNFDVVGKEAPSYEKGTNSDDYAGLKPSMSNIKDTPGENATNDTAAFSQNKAQPFGRGSGYTSKS